LPVRFGRESPTMYVVNEAVTVVFNSIACDLARIRPDVGSKVWMIDVHAGVNHADGDVAAPRRDVPSLLGTDVCAGCARSERARRRIAQTGTAEADSDRLPAVLQAPHVGELRLVGRALDVAHVIGFGVEHVWARVERGDGLQGLFGCDLHDAQARHGV